MPANRRGTSSNTDPKLKNNGAPDKALYVQLFVSSKSNGSIYLYTIYLGENDTNDYNVRRNGNCGNYHTSTPSTNGTVNCFHIHNASAALPFETGYESTRRAFAGPVRCVRDVDD